MSSLIDSVGAQATEIVIILALAGAVAGLVTYIIRRLVRRIDIMMVQLEELRSEQAVSASDRALVSHKLEVARERERDTIDLMDLKFEVWIARHRDVERRYESLDQRYDEMRRQSDEVQQQYGKISEQYVEIRRQSREILRQHRGMRQDIEELREGLREIRDRIDAEE